MMAISKSLRVAGRRGRAAMIGRARALAALLGSAECVVGKWSNQKTASPNTAISDRLTPVAGEGGGFGKIYP